MLTLKIMVLSYVSLSGVEGTLTVEHAVGMSGLEAFDKLNAGS